MGPDAFNTPSPDVLFNTSALNGVSCPWILKAQISPETVKTIGLMSFIKSNFNKERLFMLKYAGFYVDLVLQFLLGERE